jgi:predicted lipoprotein with Yx(FWY)xxD motif
MRRICSLVGVAVLLALLPAALAGAKSGPAKLQLHRTKFGMILVNGRGFTIYAFTKDRRNQDACVKSSACISVWPPVTTPGTPVLGRGVKRSLVGAITIKGGVKQVTYGGHPLYTYIADTQAAQTTYINILQFGGRWPAVNASGGEVK